MAQASEAGSASPPLLPSPERSSSPVHRESGTAQLGFWGSIAKRAKAVLLEDGIPGVAEEPPARRQEQEMPRESPPKLTQQQQDGEQPKAKPSDRETPVLQKGLDAIASSLALLGDTIGSAIEDGFNLAKEPRAATRSSVTRSSVTRKSHDLIAALQQQRLSTMGLTGGGETGFSAETQLKASRDVAMAMASKAKLLFRELKTVRADLAFLRERCTQLEEENKRLRDSVATGVRHEEDDLVRLQLETLLAEKARLAQENANFSRENQFLREVVEYHQLSLQDELPVLEDNVVDEMSDEDQVLSDESNFYTPNKVVPALGSY